MLLGTVLLILGALVGYWHYGERGRVEALERDRLQGQARVIDENLGHQLEGVNNALVGVRNDFPRSDSKSIAPGASRRLKALAGAMPGVRTISILDAEGTVLATSRDELIGMNFSQREYFKVPREYPDPATLYVSPPFKTVLGVFLINVTRVVTGSRGKFAGIVSAALDPDYFNVVLRSVLYAPDMRVAIAHGDGVGFLYMPPNERAAGIDLVKPGSFFTRHQESGQTATIMTGPVYVTGEDRMVAMRTIRPANIPMDKPLVVGVSRDLAAIYAPWRNDVLMDGGLYGAIALTSILGLTFTQRRQRKLDRVAADHERDRRESVERLELALRGGDLGLWDCHVPSGKLIFNERWSAMLGYALDEIGRDVSSWQKLVHPDDWPAVHAALDPHLKGETPAYKSEHRLRHKDGHWIWILDRGKVMERDAAGAPVRIVGTHLDVTERKNMELALRESEEKYRRVYDSLQDVYVETALDGTILEISPQVETLSVGQYKREDLLGRSAYAFYADAGRRAAFLRTLMELGSVKDFESAFINRDGSIVPCSISAMVRHGADGNPGSIVSMVRDITARKRAEESLRDSEERLRAIFEGTLDGILVVDAKSGKFLTGNPAICRMLGYTLQEFVRVSVSDIHPKQDLPHVIEEFKRLERGEIQEVPDFPVMRKDGSTFHADMQLAPIRLGVTDCALAMIRDVTERKQAAEALRASEAKFRTLAEEDLAGVVIIQDGRFNYVNPAIARMLGYSPEDLLGASSVLEFVADEDRPLVQENLRRRQEGEEQSMHYIFRGRKKDGSPAYLEVFGSRIALDGRFAVISTVLDITERKRTEQTLHDNAERLRGLSRRLIAVQETERRNINRELHDRVGQNLAALNINFNIIRSQLSQQSRDAVGARLRDTQTLLEGMAAQVRDVMADLHPPALDDYGLLAALRTYVESLGTRCAVPITVHGEDLAPRLPLATETALFRIAQEALANAVKHARARHIQLLLTATPDQVALTIEDDGVGFDAGHAPLAHASWGLAIMHERAEAVGAALRIDTAPGRGTRVVVEIEREAA